ncbi:MAG: TOBE domain-containing protein [Rhodopila sp.]|nr:TOBE domain-containing protein [Rhodopila sp.]
MAKVFAIQMAAQKDRFDRLAKLGERLAGRVSPFIARFIGSPNVLRNDQGSIAVRADRCRLGAAEDGPHVNGQVIAVEYQDAMVRVAVKTDAGDEVSALVPDQMFYRKPTEPGDLATLVWSDQDTHALMEA